MITAIAQFFGWDQPKVRRIAPTPKLLLTKACLDAVQVGLAPEAQCGHEGIVYLLGRTDGVVTIAIAVFRPQSRTTIGSFEVTSAAMAKCVAAAANFELQVVGQLHSHPGQAYHSGGDEEGARIRYAGYVSIVVPNYGRLLPSLSGIAAFMWMANSTWSDLQPSDVLLIPGAGPWTAKNG